ncbi:MAG: cytochrome c peroxidase [Pseudomonadota bacterium]
MPRNAPALFNLGAREIRVLFHDGRLSEDPYEGSGFDSPAGNTLPDGLRSIVAAQAMFPVTSETEMAGNPGENRIAYAAQTDIDRAWDLIAKRVRTIPAYSEMFLAADPTLESALEIEMVDIANAIAAFVEAEWRTTDSPFDRHLRGEAPLTGAAARGMALFYGEAGCGDCHAGALLSNQRFYALALPHFGPGRTRPFDPYVRDLGRMGETDRLEDAYRFRTPALRNVALTAPYGHNGAYPTLEGIIRHHLDPLAALEAWDRANARLPEADWLAGEDFIAMADRAEQARLRARIDIAPVAITEAEVADLAAFLEALTDEAGAAGRLGRPDTVPSGLPVD